MRGDSQDSGQQISWSFLLAEDDDAKLALESVGSAVSLVDGTRIDKLHEARHESLPTPPASTRSDHSPDISLNASEVELYNHIFGAFYSRPLTIPNTSVSATLSYCDSILRISQRFSITPLISTQLSTALKSHRHEFYVAISGDPARYLLLSIQLKDTSIYTESLIHIIGVWPCWPLRWPTKPSVLPAELSKIIKRKATELKHLVTYTENELLKLTIFMHRSGPPNPCNHSEFDTYFVVGHFRDGLANEMTALDGERTRNLKRGDFFRKIAKGGDAYMPLAQTRGLMEEVMPSVLGNLDEDWKMLKDSAMVRVEDVAKNRTLVDVEAEKIGWLTCAEIGRGDVLWEMTAEGSGHDV
ncbi:hypothetical protein DE146DRAFT_620528 [Phaeosphaeria sp. MPI-PUGE-AT-0046c]|nr:hypothetical protein DE146DRAFT_620528 [Phaeosphaeria sp. MPI-PUGE-AT-0046c]